MRIPKNGRYRKISPVFSSLTFASTLYRKRGLLRNVRFWNMIVRSGVFIKSLMNIRTRKRRLRKQSSFSMKFVPCGTSEILLRNVKYASRMKYACGIWKNGFYFTFCRKAKYFIIRKDYFISRQRYFISYMLLSVQVHIRILRQHLFGCLFDSREPRYADA